MKVSAPILKKKIIDIFKKYKLPSKHAKISADIIINAELVGASSHGLSRLKMYIDRIKRKVINNSPKIKIKKISKSISLVDADNSIGFVGADLGIKQAIKNAQSSGVGMVAVKNSGHYGLSSFYANQAIKKNMIVFCFTNAPPALAPYGAKKILFGTNPICFGSPSGTKIPFILDTSVSIINRGKIRLAAKLGKKIPLNSALNKFGKPTTNAKEAIEGVQLPIAGFKGSGLAWMVDILSGVLTGASHGGKVKDPFDDFSGPQNVGHFFIVFKSNIFSSDYKKRIKENINRIKKLPKIKGIKKILYPGEAKFNYLEKNKRKKIYINPKIFREIESL
tara:strand:- start:40 stop:1044 length:1005 start_codon:yes stop_codon:yes gene_type:complete